MRTALSLAPSTPPAPRVAPTTFRTRFVEDEDPLFLSLLSGFTLLAAAFFTWVYVTPPPEPVTLPLLEDVRPLLPPAIPFELTPPRPPPVTPPAVDHPAAHAPSPVPPAAPDRRPAESPAQRSLLIQRLGHEGDGRDTTEEILGAGSTEDLQRALQGVHGVATARAGVVGTRQGSGKGREDVDVSIGAATSGETKMGAGPQVAVKRPVVGVEPPTSDATEGDPAVIASIVKKSAGLVQSCVEVSLKANPDMSGRVELAFAIHHGRVRAATVEGNDTGDTALGDCIAHAVRTMRFPEDISANVELPFAVSGR